MSHKIPFGRSAFIEAPLDHFVFVIWIILNTCVVGEVYTPFLIAVRNGHTQLVRLLLEQFQINQSQHTGTLNFDGYLIEG